MTIERRTLYLFGALLSVVLLFISAYLEHFTGLTPCPLCLVQRYLMLCLGITCLLAWAHNPKNQGKYFYTSFVFILSGIGSAIAGRHVWIQTQPSGAVPSCGADLEYVFHHFPWRDIIDHILKGGGECHDVHYQFLNLSLAEWSLLSFGLYLLISLILFIRN